jgi:hypothetical protein
MNLNILEKKEEKGISAVLVVYGAFMFTIGLDGFLITSGSRHIPSLIESSLLVIGGSLLTYLSWKWFKVVHARKWYESIKKK